jgi:hypothetical protein
MKRREDNQNKMKEKRNRRWRVGREILKRSEEHVYGYNHFEFRLDPFCTDTETGSQTPGIQHTFSLPMDTLCHYAFRFPASGIVRWMPHKVITEHYSTQQHNKKPTFCMSLLATTVSAFKLPTSAPPPPFRPTQLTLHNVGTYWSVSAIKRQKDLSSSRRSLIPDHDRHQLCPTSIQCRCKLQTGRSIFCNVTLAAQREASLTCSPWATAY